MEDVIISGRHFDVTDELTDVGHAKMARIAGEYNKLTTARIVMCVEKSRQKAEIQLEGKNLDLHAEAETHDMYASLEEAFDRIEVPLRKYLDRIQEHHGKHHGADERPPPAATAPIDEEEAEEELAEEVALQSEAS
jgi:putative sigma-54 modulation protein